jgi:hypothetical protein
MQLETLSYFFGIHAVIGPYYKHLCQDCLTLARPRRGPIDLHFAVQHKKTIIRAKGDMAN